MADSEDVKVEVSANGEGSSSSPQPVGRGEGLEEEEVEFKALVTRQMSRVGSMGVGLHEMESVAAALADSDRTVNRVSGAELRNRLGNARRLAAQLAGEALREDESDEDDEDDEDDENGVEIRAGVGDEAPPGGHGPGRFGAEVGGGRSDSHAMKNGVSHGGGAERGAEEGGGEGGEGGSVGSGGWEKVKHKMRKVHKAKKRHDLLEDELKALQSAVEGLEEHERGDTLSRLAAQQLRVMISQLSVTLTESKEDQRQLKNFRAKRLTRHEIRRLATVAEDGRRRSMDGSPTKGGVTSDPEDKRAESFSELLPVQKGHLVLVAMAAILMLTGLVLSQPFVPHDDLLHGIYVAPSVVPLDLEQPLFAVEMVVKAPPYLDGGIDPASTASGGQSSKRDRLASLRSLLAGGGGGAAKSHPVLTVSLARKNETSGEWHALVSKYVEYDRHTTKVQRIKFHPEDEGISSHGPPVGILLQSNVDADNGEMATAVLVEAWQYTWFGANQQWFGAALMVLVLGAIAAEVFHRTLVALTGAFCMLGLLMLVDKLPSMATTVGWLDMSTLAFLFGMMIVVGLFAQTGAFEVLTMFCIQASGGDKFRLLILLCALTGGLSAFLDNVTTVLLIAPVTLTLASALNIDPLPYLMCLTMFSNVGGTSTMIGDPPNIIIGSGVSGYGVGFLDFIRVLMPGVLIMSVPVMFLCRWHYGSAVVGPLRDFEQALKLAENFKIHDYVLLGQSLIAVSAVLIGLLLHPVHHNDPAWIACMGAIFLCVVASPHDLHDVLHMVEWDTLLFFAGLFVCVESVVEMGLMDTVGEALADFIIGVEGGKTAQTMASIAVLMWPSAILSALLDNIPVTAMLVPVIIRLFEHPELDLGIEPLAFAVCFGACLGGNGTMIGASANVVVVGIAARAGKFITFNSWLKIGFPVMVLSVTIAMVYLMLINL